MSDFKYIEPGRFTVTGDLTFASVPEVWKQARKSLLEVFEDSLEIDIGAAKKFDSGGLALMVAWSRWAHCNNKDLVFRNATEKTQKLVEINKLQDVLNIHIS
ncbi:MAG: STAS domain-containing protein [Gammaproteobacteria bacterium]|nr:MAG: STAS domain-containing protein [Gammaproteobacteria bacterium]